MKDPSTRSGRAIAAWLFVCAGFVFAMVVVGGLTRLSRSGLSIVEWAPISGILPPLGDDAWLSAFAAYKGSPEGSLINTTMDLDGFKKIFLVEWTHRLLGRLTGFVVLLPFLFFVATKKLRGPRAVRILAIFLLGGLQGFIGWYMVKSGLVDVPRVSHLRLALHLGLALTLLALLVHSALDEVFPVPTARVPASVRSLATTSLVLIALTALWGAFMAGLHAGLAAPTFPSMNGSFFPPGIFSATAWAGGLVDHPLTVHFLHRMLAASAVLVASMTCATVFIVKAPRRARIGATLVAGSLVGQVVLGVLTVLHHVPIGLAALHQMNAALLLAFTVALVHALRAPRV